MTWLAVERAVLCPPPCDVLYDRDAPACPRCAGAVRVPLEALIGSLRAAEPRSEDFPPVFGCGDV